MVTRTPLVVISERRRADVTLVADEAHYVEVVERGLLTAQTSVWIATANVKDVHVPAPIGSRSRASGKASSLFEWLKQRADNGLDVRLLHAGNPSRVLAANPAWQRAAKLRRACPRVHLKMMAIDGRLLYLGSANFTGAGLGAKAPGRRNFELGLVTDDSWLLDETQRAFDEIWSGKRCGNCRRRAHCPKPLDEHRARPREGASAAKRQVRSNAEASAAKRQVRPNAEASAAKRQVRPNADARRTKPKKVPGV